MGQLGTLNENAFYSVRFVEYLNLKSFSRLRKYPIKAFLSLDVYKKKLDLDGLNFDQKSVYATSVAKQASSFPEDVDIIRELELNEALAEVGILAFSLLHYRV